MQGDERENGRDRVHIADEVISSIAALAAARTPNVAIAGAGGGEGRTGLRGMMGQGRAQGRGVKLDSNGDGVSLELSVAMEYGCKIDEAAKALQGNVREDVERMTGLCVTRVLVRVVGFVQEGARPEREPGAKEGAKPAKEGARAAREGAKPAKEGARAAKESARAAKAAAESARAARAALESRAAREARAAKADAAQGAKRGEAEAPKGARPHGDALFVFDEPYAGGGGAPPPAGAP